MKVVVQCERRLCVHGLDNPNANFTCSRVLIIDRCTGPAGHSSALYLDLEKSKDGGLRSIWQFNLDRQSPKPTAAPSCRWL